MDSPSHSFTSQPDDLDQQEAPNQKGRESDKPKNDAPHGEGITTAASTRSDAFVAERKAR